VRANKHKPHVLVLPEDDANGRMANGFHIELNQDRQFQVLKPAGGWIKVLNWFNSYHAAKMRSYQQRYCVLLIDFDADVNRLQEAMARIPDDLTDRVFIIGVLSEPQELRRALLKSYETIGGDLARDCRDGVYSMWKENLLQHNASELERLRQDVRPILFSSL
jgi:hypothetical protein